jgi:hypothetical protein
MKHTYKVELSLHKCIKESQHIFRIKQHNKKERGNANWLSEKQTSFFFGMKEFFVPFRSDEGDNMGELKEKFTTIA